MWIAWFVFGLIQFATNRWFIHLSKNLPYIHLISGIIITGITAAYVIVLINTFGLDLYGIHNIIGFIMFCMVGLVTIGGLAVSASKWLIQWNTKLVLKIRLVHKLFGFVIWLIGIVTLCFGIKSYSD
jgi:hypothetical protein